MKIRKNCWQMRRFAGIILACTFLTACGGGIQTPGNKIETTTQEKEIVNIGNVEPADEQTQEATQEAEDLVQSGNI